MKTIKLELPDLITLDSMQLKMIIASWAYTKGQLTLGQAAAMVGLSKRAFMELLDEYNVSVFNDPLTDLDDDIKNAKDYTII